MFTKIKQKFKRITKFMTYLGIFCVIVLIIVGVVSEFFKKEPPEKLPPVINPTFKELPRPNFKDVPGLSWSKKLSVHLPVTQDMPDTLDVYKLEPFNKLPLATSSATLIANQIGVEAPLRETNDSWVFESKTSFLRIRKSDLSWDLKNELEKTGSRIFEKEVLVSNFIKFIKEAGFYAAILEEADIKVTTLDDNGFILIPAEDPSNPDFYTFDFYLQKDSVPVVSQNSQEFVMSATVSRFGEIFSIQYSLASIVAANVGTYPVLSYSTVSDALGSGKGVIVDTGAGSFDDFLGKGVVSNFNVAKTDLVYFQDIEHGFLTPVWQFEGEGKLENGVYVNLKVWLPGISTEWLK